MCTESPGGSSSGSPTLPCNPPWDPPRCLLSTSRLQRLDLLRDRRDRLGHRLAFPPLHTHTGPANLRAPRAAPLRLGPLLGPPLPRSPPTVRQSRLPATWA